MDRLILLPESPAKNDGYGKAVRSDLARLEPTRRDLVVVYTSIDRVDLPEAVVIPRPSRRSPRRARNLLRGRCPPELDASELRPWVSGRTFDQVFCGDTPLYRAARDLFPETPITVRFHNLFLLGRTRHAFLGTRLDPGLRIHLRLVAELEREILLDRRVTPIFITPQELRFAELLCRREGATWWSVVNPPDTEPLGPPAAPLLLYFGSVSAHLKLGVVRLAEEIVPAIRRVCPEVELHLYGRDTEQFDAPARGVHGHGFFEGTGLPRAGEGLFVVPDLVGGGIKIKVSDLLAAGVPFITTPFGTEGYDLPDRPDILVEELDGWPEVIIDYLRGCGLVSGGRA